MTEHEKVYADYAAMLRDLRAREMGAKPSHSFSEVAASYAAMVEAKRAERSKTQPH